MREASDGRGASATRSEAWAREVRLRLSPLHLPPTREADIIEELSQHLDDRWRELMAAGALPEEATRVTLAEFRGEDVLARYLAPLRLARQPPPLTPGASAGRFLGDLWQDLRLALRTMKSSPGFSVVAIVSLALGIGANTAIFSLWNGLLRATLPAVEKPEQLVMFSDPDDSGSWNGRTDGVRKWLTYEEFEQLRDHAGAFSGVMASQSGLAEWQVRFDENAWEQATGRLVSGQFFEVLGVRPAIGRVFTAAEDRVAAPTAVISHTFWQRRFGGRPDVLGKTFFVRSAAITIVGVAARGFIGETNGQEPDLWMPLRMQPVVLPGRDRLHDTPPTKTMWLNVFGRLKPAVTAAEAEVRANAVFQAGLESFYGAAMSAERRREVLNQRLQIRSGGQGASLARHELSQSLTALLAGVGVLLMIACANLANLLLARATARKSEVALRLSLGASRGRLIRQLLTENLALAIIGAAAAIALASVFHGALVRMIAKSDSDFRMTFAFDLRVFAFMLATTSAATVLFGGLPAWQVTRADISETLKHLSRAVGGAGQLRSGRFLVSLQLALSLPLLVGAGLLARTAYNLQHAELGFPAERLLLVRVDLRDAAYEPARRIARLRELVDEIGRMPGVRATSFSELGVFSGGESAATIAVEGHTPKGEDDRGSAFDVVGPGYFAALGAPIVLGRDVLESDQGAPAICVINEAFAGRFFDGRNPLGMRITALRDSEQAPCQVVGVARNARTHKLRGSVEPQYFLPASQRPSSATLPFFLIRTNVDSQLMTAAVRAVIRRVDGSLPILSAASIEEQMAPLTAQDRTTAQLAVVFGCVALTLAAIGLYGLLSYGIARRTAELGIRIALGAQSRRVIAMILGETIGLVAFGLGLGAALAYAASRLVTSRLYGIAPQDPMTFVLAIALLVLVAIGAAYWPARRASRLDPMAALRQC